MIKLIFCLFVLNALCEKKIFTPETNIQMEKFSLVDTMSNGERIAYTTSQFSLENNKKTLRLYITTVTGDIITSKELNYSNIHDMAWVPNKNIISFFTDANGKSKAIFYDVDGDTFIEGYEFPLSIDSVRWSANGNYFVFSTEVYPGMTIEETIAKDTEKNNRKAKYMDFNQTFFYHWDTWQTGKFRHIMYVKVTYNLQGNYPSLNGTVKDVMKALDGDCPSKPWGGKEEYDISPEETHITFCTQLGRNQSFNLEKNIYVAQIFDGQVEQPDPEQLTFGGGRYNCPIFACLNEGTDAWTTIYFVATHSINYEASETHIHSYTRDTGFIREITKSTENSIDSLAWTKKDINCVFGLSNRKGHRTLVVIDTLTGREKEDKQGNPLVLNEDGSVTSFMLINNDTGCNVVMTKSSYLYPTELYYWAYSEIDSSSSYKTLPASQRITSLSNSTLDECYKLSPPEDVWFTGANGDMVHGFYFSPVDIVNAPEHTTHTSKSTGLHPLIMYIHGGPESAWLDEWSDRWNPQLLAQRGFALFAINYHGSDSYGQSFTESLQGHWGDLPFEDLMLGLSYILDYKKDELDPNRLAAMGASYGGYMVNWLQTHTNVFKCLICHDGLFDTESEYEETEELYFLEVPHYGAPWESTLYSKSSPAYFTTDSRYTQTPQLTIHGGNDFRVPLSQGIMAFQTLQGKGIPSRLLYFPEENHWVLNPFNSQRWHQEVIAWLMNYV